MAFLHIKRPWTRQPTGRVYFNDQLTGVLPVMWQCGWQIASPNEPVQYGGVSRSALGKGACFSFSGADSASPGRRIEFLDIAAYDITGAITVFCVFEKRTPPYRSNRGLLSKWIGYSSVPVSQRSYTLSIDYQSHASNDYVSLSVSGNGSTSIVSGVGAHVGNGYHCLVGRYIPSVSVTTFLDGAQYATNTSSVISSIYNSSSPLWIGAQYSILPDASKYSMIGEIFASAVIPNALPDALCRELTKNPWLLFAPERRIIYFDVGAGGATTYTSYASLDALVQQTGIARTVSIDALLQAVKSTQIGVDALVAAVQQGLISVDALIQATGGQTVSFDALVQAAKVGTLSLDALVRATLITQTGLDAVLSGASGTSVVLDALLQATKASGASVDALIASARTGALTLDALVLASKSNTLSLDAFLVNLGSNAVVAGLDALVQAVQTKAVSFDALLAKTYTTTATLDALLVATGSTTISLDALVQATKTGALSLDALLQLTRSATVTLDALIALAGQDAVSVDAVLAIAASVSSVIDAYVQASLSRRVSLDAILGELASAFMPDGRIVSVQPQDRFVLAAVQPKRIITLH